jgi:hypothetical protein
MSLVDTEASGKLFNTHLKMLGIGVYPITAVVFSFTTTTNGIVIVFLFTFGKIIHH